MIYGARMKVRRLVNRLLLSDSQTRNNGISALTQRGFAYACYRILWRKWRAKLEFSTRTPYTFLLTNFIV